MTFAVSDRIALRYIAESNWGVIPVAGNGANLRMTGESLKFDVQKASSEELRPDGQTSGSTIVGASASGSYNLELSYGEHDPLFAGVLRNTWSSFGVNGVLAMAAVTLAFTATTITAASATSAFTSLQRGQWFLLSKSGGLNDGKLLRVSPTTDPTTTVITLDAATPAVVEAATAAYTIMSQRLTNGVLNPSFVLEVEHNDIGQFRTYSGMVPGQLSLDISSNARAVGSIGFMGKAMQRGVTTKLPGTAAGSRSYPMMNGETGVGILMEGGTSLTSTSIKNVKLDVNWNLRPQEAIGSAVGLAGVGYGGLSVSGTLDAYFADGSLLDKYLANADTSLMFAIQDANRNGYVITLPHVNYSACDTNGGGKNQDVMASLQFSAYADDANAVAALRKTLFIDRFGPALT